MKNIKKMISVMFCALLLLSPVRADRLPAALSEADGEIASKYFCSILSGDLATAKGLLLKWASVSKDMKGLCLMQKELKDEAFLKTYQYVYSYNKKLSNKKSGTAYDVEVGYLYGGGDSKIYPVSAVGTVWIKSGKVAKDKFDPEDIGSEAYDLSSSEDTREQILKDIAAYDPKITWSYDAYMNYFCDRNRTINYETATFFLNSETTKEIDANSEYNIYRSISEKSPIQLWFGDEGEDMEEAEASEYSTIEFKVKNTSSLDATIQLTHEDGSTESFYAPAGSDLNFAFLRRFGQTELLLDIAANGLEVYDVRYSDRYN